MRPTELRLRNFRSYAGEHVFDFADRHLVGIVGPIGSGKSSILDAIVFALYGRTPRIPTATKTLINQRAADASVALRFEVEGELWEAVRSIRIKGPSKHALYRYEEAGLDPVEKLTLEGEVNDRVQLLLGLDYAAFERSVLLAQGRFAEFLQARPADRDRVLKGVFGHDRVDRMKSLAKEKRDAATVALEKLEIRLERFEELEERLAEMKAELGESKVRGESLARVAERVVTVDERTKVLTGELDTVSKRLHNLDEHADRLPEQTQTERLLEDAATQENARTKLAADLDAAQKRLQAAEAAFQQASESGESDVLERASALLAAADPQLKAVVGADRRIGAAAEAMSRAREDVEAAVQRREEAEHVRDTSLGRAAEAAKILEEAEAALERGRHADMAATLRAGLEEDAPCPVCEQIVADLPEQAAAAHLAELEALLVTARRTKADVDETHSASLATLEGMNEQLAAARDKVKAAEAQHAGAREDAIRVRGDLEETTIRLEKLLGPGDTEELLETRRNTYETTVAEREEAQRAVDQVRGKHDQAIRDEQEATKALQELRLKLADLAARLEMTLDVGDDAASLRTALDQLRQAWKDVTAQLRDDRAQVDEELAKLAAERSQLLEEYQIEGDVTAALAVVTDRIARLEMQIADDSAEFEKSSELAKDRSRLETDVEVFGRINSDLTDSRFIRFLLDDERVRLAELGSEHFQRLSAGRYRFADDQFAILDLTAADSVRRADSLSGGETFLASLGLALALAEMVAGTGGRMDAFFLDEGFGTLDPEHLDLAMEGIETMVADQSNRIVVIVSHVPELRDRIEDLIELERSPVTGDTRVVAG